MLEAREMRIRDLAYSFWERDHRPYGRHDEHWGMAERMLDEADEGGSAVAGGAETDGDSGRARPERLSSAARLDGGTTDA